MKVFSFAISVKARPLFFETFVLHWLSETHYVNIFQPELLRFIKINCQLKKSFPMKHDAQFQLKQSFRFFISKTLNESDLTIVSVNIRLQLQDPQRFVLGISLSPSPSFPTISSLLFLVVTVASPLFLLHSFSLSTRQAIYQLMSSAFPSSSPEKSGHIVWLLPKSSLLSHLGIDYKNQALGVQQVLCLPSNLQNGNKTHKQSFLQVQGIVSIIWGELNPQRTIV